MAEVIVIIATACHLCEDALDALAELSETFPLSVREVDALSSEGISLVERHRPAMPPAVLIDGELFSSGRLPRKKLRRLLERESVA